MIESILPFLAVLIPLLSVFIIPFLEEKQCNKVTAIATVMTVIIIASMYPYISQGTTLTYSIDSWFYIKMAFMADYLSFLAGMAAIFLWALASIYAVGYMDHEHSLKRYNIFSLLSLTGMLGVVFTRNLFSLYLFFEILSVASYVMVIHEETPEAKSAGLTYLFMGISGGLILLFSIVATYSITGTVDLTEIIKAVPGLKGHPGVPFIFFGYIIGFGVKAGVFPVHIWLPTAHPVAPSPASALLSGVMIKAGAYGILRTIYSIFGTELLATTSLAQIMVVVAIITMLLGSVMAIQQTELKKMLAYSSIAQMGYIILGASILSPLGLTGSIIHVFHHALMKGTLFLCAGAFIHQTGLRKLEDLKGMGKRMPLTMACFTLAALSMIGIPPFVGFISKWYLAIGALQSDHQGTIAGSGMWVVGALLLSSILNAFYYGPIIVRAWLSDPVKTDKEERIEQVDPKWVMMAPLCVLGGCVIVLGLFPQFAVGLAKNMANIYFKL